MPPQSRRGLTRVEREWADVPFQPLDDVFQMAGTGSEDEAVQLAQGLAHAWITWYMALAKPVRRRNARVLLDRLHLPVEFWTKLARAMADDQLLAYRFLSALTVAVARVAWLARDRGSDAPGEGPVPSDLDLDWDLWTGPGGGEAP